MLELYHNANIISKYGYLLIYIVKISNILLFGIILNKHKHGN
nr:MAG TPA: hypothetical protein [Bacteriophage sp.]